MPLNFREMNVNVFSGKPNPHVFFQPRITSWITYKMMQGGMDLPEQYQKMEMRDIHREMDVSMRYLMDFTPPDSPVELHFDTVVNVKEKTCGNKHFKEIGTPFGILNEESRFTDDGFWRQTEFAVKGANDLQAFRWLLGHMHYEFNSEKFEIGETYMGDLGEPQFYLPKSPYQAMLQQWSTLLPVVYMVNDHQAEMEAIFDEVDVLSDQLFEQLNDYGRVKIINVGENLHQALLSPKYFEKYYLPYYEKRLTQLHEGGIYCHIHVDGDFHDFLPYLSKMSFDGYEALTPIPQGDVTLEEMRDAIGDKVLLDGIPGIYFMPNVPRAELMACVEKLYDYFYPRLVLGASDEVPQGCDSVEAIERVKMVAKWCRVHG